MPSNNDTAHRQGIHFKYESVNGQYQYTFCSGAVINLLGYTAGELTGKEIRFLHCYDNKAFDYYDRAWKDEEQVAFEFYYREMRFSALLTPVIDKDKVVEVIGSYSEIDCRNVDVDTAESEENYRRLLEDAFVGVFVYQDEKLVYCNTKMAEMFGYSKCEFLQLSAFSLLDEDEMEIKNAIAFSMEKKETVSFQVKAKKKDGRIFIMEGFRNHIVYNNKPALMGMMLDITDRVNTQILLQNSEERYKNLLRLSPIPIVIHSDGILLYGNESALNFIGAKDHSELLGKSVLDLIHPDPQYQNMAKERIHQVANQEPLPFVEQKIVTLDGQIRDVFVCSIGVTQYLDKQLIQTVALDITERKRMERDILEAENKYRILVEKALFGVYQYTDGKITYVNPRFADIFGYTQEELCDADPFLLMDEESYESLRNNIALRLSGKAVSTYFRYKGRKKDRTIIEVEGNGTITNINGKPTIIGMLTDITERSKTEEMLRKSEKLAALGQLAAGIAHEIRNPLTALRGFIQLLQSKSENDPRYMEIMLSEINRINSIVSEFMFLANPQMGNNKLENIKALLEDIIAFLQAEASLRNVQIMTEFSSRAPMVMCNETQIKQVFVNIIKNGIEAMPNGGVLHIVIRQNKQQEVLIQFTDHGIGMSEERVRRIGEPFYTTKEKGTGLGLMMCYKIIEAHQGKIEVKSKVNKGTTIQITFPRIN